MARFKLISEDVNLNGEPSGDRVTIEFTAVHLQEVLARVQDFLRGSGFYVGDVGDYLDIVTDGDFREKLLGDDK